MSTLTTELTGTFRCLSALDNTSCRPKRVLVDSTFNDTKTPLFHQTNHNDHIMITMKLITLASFVKPQPSNGSNRAGSPNRVDYRVGDNLEQWLTACIKQLLRLGDEHIDTHIELFFN